MKDITLLSHIQSLQAPAKGAVSPPAAGFQDALKNAVSQVNQLQVEADQAVQQLQTGEAKNLHEVMISMEKADISLRLLVQMRNKVVEAYQEIMRMQV